MKIGENIKALRKARGLTQEQLADMLGLSFQAVSKWETNANTPDISLLPMIAKALGTSIDQLFSEINPDSWEGAEMIKDDDVIRIVQLQGHRILKATPVSQKSPSFSIIFPRDCNNETQYFKVEVFGHVIADSSINGDVICHGNIDCSDINSFGPIQVSGNLSANRIHLTEGKIVCGSIQDCHEIRCPSIECKGDIHAASIINTQERQS